MNLRLFESNVTRGLRASALENKPNKRCRRQRPAKAGAQEAAQLPRGGHGGGKAAPEGEERVFAARAG